MTDALVEKLTPKDLGELDPARRNEVLEAIAEVCVAQGEYRLAATKFHQAKNSLKVCSLFKALSAWFYAMEVEWRRSR